jgi:hypothetical protein
MKRSLMAICAVAIAAPLAFAATPAPAQGFSLELGPDGPRLGLYTEGPRVYYNGYRGYRERRPGYRNRGGYWFPHEAFVDRRHTGSVYDYDRRREYRRNYGRAHVEWCYDRYRSYRASDNTFQPYSGPREQCYSPYS